MKAIKEQTEEHPIMSDTNLLMKNFKLTVWRQLMIIFPNESRLKLRILHIVIFNLISWFKRQKTVSTNLINKFEKFLLMNDSNKSTEYWK